MEMEGKAGNHRHRFQTEHKEKKKADDEAAFLPKTFPSKDTLVSFTAIGAGGNLGTGI